MMSSFHTEKQKFDIEDNIDRRVKYTRNSLELSLSDVFVLPNETVLHLAGLIIREVKTSLWKKNKNLPWQPQRRVSK